MSTIRRIMTPRRDGEPSNEYRDFLVVDGLNCDDARIYIGTDEELPASTAGATLVWRDAGGSQHKDVVTASAYSPSRGWNTSLDVAAVEFLRERDILVRGWNAR